MRCSAAQCRAAQGEDACAVPLRAVPRRAGNARGAERDRNDRRRMEILAKVRDEPMRRGAATVDAGSVELRR